MNNSCATSNFVLVPTPFAFPVFTMNPREQTFPPIPLKWFPLGYMRVQRHSVFPWG